MSRCVVCDDSTSGSLDWCRKHYHEYKDEIKDKKAWTKALKNEAQRERRRREREYENVSLDGILDREYTRRY